MQIKLSRRVTLSVKVPKTIEPGPGPIVMEQILQTFSILQEEKPGLSAFFGIKRDTISLELANYGRIMKFIINCPRKYQSFVESQMYAHYPNAEIFEEKDYIKGKGRLFYTYLYHNTVPIFPIKRYSQFEDKLSGTAVDPVAGITSAFSQLAHPLDETWVQIVLSPLDEKWRVKLAKVVKALRKGIYGSSDFLQNIYVKISCNRGFLFRLLSIPLRLAFWIQIKIMSDENAARANELEANAVNKMHDKESVLDACTDKINKVMFETSIRIGYLSFVGSKDLAHHKLKEVAGSFSQFNLPAMNGFKRSDILQDEDKFVDFKRRLLRKSESVVLNVEELATIFHLPSSAVQTPNIDWVKSRKIEPPIDLPTEETVPSDNLTLIGKTNYRGMHQIFGMKCDPDRRRHMYVIGKTGMGKTTLLENMIYSDIQSGKGVGVIDPHGDLAERVIDFVPKNRINDVIYFDPSDFDNPIAFNMLESPNSELNNIIGSGLIGVFKKLYSESWGPRLEHILRNTILSLLEYPDTTMLGIIRILQDSDYRYKVVKKLNDPVLRAFWEEEFAKMTDKLRIEAISPILNKVGQFLSSSMIRNIVGQTKSKLNLRFAMDKGKIIIMNLSKGKIGEDSSSLLGSMLITKFQLDAMSRADIPEHERKDFFLYVDEFQNFATQSFATILSEARKYRLNLTMANQYIAQMPEEVRDAVFGNVGSLISFQVGYDDAEYFSSQFGEVVSSNDLVALNKYTVYARLMVDGMPTSAFSADTLSPPEGQMEIDPEKREKILRVSREKFGEKRAIVEDKIQRWSQNNRPEDRVDLSATTSVAKMAHVHKAINVNSNFILNDNHAESMRKTNVSQQLETILLTPEMVSKPEQKPSLSNTSLPVRKKPRRRKKKKSTAQNPKNIHQPKDKVVHAKDKIVHEYDKQKTA